ncbi:hypothetical protein F4775DRAFT_422912 [Biscogniauxia sp. FL1348]|nr:hypothetical protein F4775DRAFT_422912 [Biscogniauxia sp. FL1348]
MFCHDAFHWAGCSVPVSKEDGRPRLTGNRGIDLGISRRVARPRLGVLNMSYRTCVGNRQQILAQSSYYSARLIKKPVENNIASNGNTAQGILFSGVEVPTKLCNKDLLNILRVTLVTKHLRYDLHRMSGLCISKLDSVIENGNTYINMDQCLEVTVPCHNHPVSFSGYAVRSYNRVMRVATTRILKRNKTRQMETGNIKWRDAGGVPAATCSNTTLLKSPSKLISISSGWQALRVISY